VQFCLLSHKKSRLHVTMRSGHLLVSLLCASVVQKSLAINSRSACAEIADSMPARFWALTVLSLAHRTTAVPLARRETGIEKAAVDKRFQRTAPAPASSDTSSAASFKVTDVLVRLPKKIPGTDTDVGLPVGAECTLAVQNGENGTSQCNLPNSCDAMGLYVDRATGEKCTGRCVSLDRKFSSQETTGEADCSSSCHSSGTAVNNRPKISCGNFFWEVDPDDNSLPPNTTEDFWVTTMMVRIEKEALPVGAACTQDEDCSNKFCDLSGLYKDRTTNVWCKERCVSFHNKDYLQRLAVCSSSQVCTTAGGFEPSDTRLAAANCGDFAFEEPEDAPDMADQG